MPIVAVYAALFALMFVFLSLRTIRLRQRYRIAVGDAGNEELLRAMRVHGNFAEYVPFALLLLYLVEVGGARPAIVHTLAATLLLGRLAHAFGVSQLREELRFRRVGMILTFAVMLSSACILLFLSLYRPG